MIGIGLSAARFPGSSTANVIQPGMRAFSFAYGVTMLGALASVRAADLIGSGAPQSPAMTFTYPRISRLRTAGSTTGPHDAAFSGAPGSRTD